MDMKQKNKKYVIVTRMFRLNIVGFIVIVIYNMLLKDHDQQDDVNNSHYSTQHRSGGVHVQM